ncbi:MAG: DUF6015 family protein [Thermoplasmatales archaeon]
MVIETIASQAIEINDSTFREDNTESRFVTPGALTNAILYASGVKGITMVQEASETIANQVMAFFGYYYEVIDNHLENEDRQSMYLLEDLDLVKLQTEDIYLPDGHSWRMTKFLLNWNKVLDYSEKYAESIDDPKNLYESLSEDQWKRF